MHDRSSSKGEPGVKPSYIVAIGASAGGLSALEQFFDHMPVDSGMVFIIIQHLSPDFKSLMDDLLARHTSMAIHRVSNGIELKPDSIYLIPPKTQMTIQKEKLYLKERGIGSHIELPIDIFFNSLAEDVGARAVGVILSGSGSDGSRGIVAIHRKGGLAVAQSPETAQFDGMPRSAIATNVCNFILAPDRIPQVLLEYAADPDTVRVKRHEELMFVEKDGEYAGLFSLLRRNYSLDFSLYKDQTVTRRIRRRMEFRQISDVSDYVTIVSGDRDELNLLYKDLLIGVTEFFRNPEAYQFLEEEIIPQLFSNLRRGEELRVWSAGCATGEEAYSLAILLAEQADAIGFLEKITVFATDAHKASLDFASQGVYDRARLANVKSEWLERHFKQEGDDLYRVTAELRKKVVFAPHNLLSDPPFTRIDLISCRNLLIYLQPAAQEKVVSLFQFALKQGGVLFMGKSEGVGAFAGEFEPITSQLKIFRKIREPRLPLQLESKALDLGHRPATGPIIQNISPRSVTIDRQLLADYDAILRDYLPPGVLVDEGRQILHYFGDVSSYLKPQEGRLQTNLMALVEDSLMVALNTSFHRADRTRQKMVMRNIRVHCGEQEQLVNLAVTPLYDEKTKRTHYHVSFDQVRPVDSPPPLDHGESESFNPGAQFRQYVSDLEAELHSTRESLQATNEELQSSNEELQAANEEMLAANEELQSTNEELHSVNEELYTVNAEQERLNAELKRLNTDHENLLTSIDTGVIFLDSELRIRKFNPAINAFFKLLPQDIGRPIDHIAYHLAGQREMLDKVNEVLATGIPLEIEAKTLDNRWLLPRIMPFRNETGQTEGVVLTFSDITKIKDAEQRLQQLNDELEQRVQDRVQDLHSEIEEHRRTETALRDHEQFMRSTLDGLSAHICVFDQDGRIVVTNRSWKKFASENGGIVELVSEGANYLEVLNPCSDEDVDNLHSFRNALQDVLSGESEGFALEYPCDSADESRWFICRVDAFEAGRSRYVVVSHENITERRRMEDELRQSEKRYRVLFEQSGVVKLIIDPETGAIVDASPAACAFYGYRRDEMRSRNIKEINTLSKEEIETEMALAGTEQRDVFRFKHRLANGDIHDVEVLSSPLELDGRNLLYSVVVDVSEKNRLEERLQMAEKAESLRCMAGAIAHNFNNMLSAVIGNLELIKEESWHRPNLEKYADQAYMASQRAATISRFMLTYLGKTVGKMEVINAVEAVRGTCSLLSLTLPVNVRLKTDLPMEGPDISGDSAHLTQILTNIITNSVEAIGEDGGEISVTLDTVSGQPLKSMRLFPINWHPSAETYLRLSIGDTGHGIAAENMNKIFDPFFSTKFAGRGLGLSVALGLLQGFQGAVSVDTNHDQGVTFHLFLPVMAENVADPKVVKEPSLEDSVANGLILVVDDELVILNLAKAILERKLKCQTITATDGFEALELFKARKDEIRLVILDLVMPGIDGWTTLTALREVQPSIMVILSSGYDEAQMTKGVRERPNAYLPKPYGASDLERAIATALMAPPDGQETICVERGDIGQ